ncbi:hypothetical protein GCM10010347_42290 [Streptomyces cirratus]|uniref:Uncharacterized protein n=1 Tax=Streptomyces cirratus TaxID=68187 RepID=A0ABQ3EYV8_9ACTN|nr:hypothetical protein GCM10010347_42290 [Streptomyces cirratus]
MSGLAHLFGHQDPEVRAPAAFDPTGRAPVEPQAGPDEHVRRAAAADPPTGTKSSTSGGRAGTRGAGLLPAAARDDLVAALGRVMAPFEMFTDPPWRGMWDSWASAGAGPRVVSCGRSSAG